MKMDHISRKNIEKNRWKHILPPTSIFFVVTANVELSEIKYLHEVKYLYPDEQLPNI